MVKKKLATGYKDIVVIWEEPDRYMGRRTPAVSYTFEDLEDDFPEGTYKNMHDPAARKIIERLSEPGGTMESFFDRWGDPAWIGIMENKGCS